jgi:Zn-finger nucleic acid-binding protein
MESLTCPKCHGAMRNYERSGVTIDQCADCRGIFLDRGELEHLIDADARFQAGSAPVATPPPSRDYDHDRDHDHDRDKRRDDRYDSYGSKPRKKKRSIFEELFD